MYVSYSCNNGSSFSLFNLEHIFINRTTSSDLLCIYIFMYGLLLLVLLMILVRSFYSFEEKRFLVKEVCMQGFFFFPLVPRHLDER